MFFTSSFVLAAGGAEIGVGVIAIVVTFFLIRWKNSRTRTMVEKHLVERGIAAVCTGKWMPPLRLWLNNRKGDGWCQIKLENNQLKWVRVRGGFSGRSFDFFD